MQQAETSNASKPRDTTVTPRLVITNCDCISSYQSGPVIPYSIINSGYICSILNSPHTATYQRMRAFIAIKASILLIEINPPLPINTHHQAFHSYYAASVVLDFYYYNMDAFISSYATNVVNDEPRRPAEQPIPQDNEKPRPGGQDDGMTETENRIERKNLHCHRNSFPAADRWQRL